jgi:hypothetical protein
MVCRRVITAKGRQTMKRAAVVLVFAAFALSAAAAKDTAGDEFQHRATGPAAHETAGPETVDQVFTRFGLFGNWAANCHRPASPDNPHVRVIMPSPGLVFEEHDLGPAYAGNRYSVLSAEQESATDLAVQVIFQPGKANEERQRLVFRVHGNTRRTMFNQTEGGTLRVKDGVALAHKKKTPVLKKCGEERAGAASAAARES